MWSKIGRVFFQITNATIQGFSRNGFDSTWQHLDASLRFSLRVQSGRNKFLSRILSLETPPQRPRAPRRPLNQHPGIRNLIPGSYLLRALLRICSICNGPCPVCDQDATPPSCIELDKSWVGSWRCQHWCSASHCLDIDTIALEYCMLDVNILAQVESSGLELNPFVFSDFYCRRRCASSEQ